MRPRTVLAFLLCLPALVMARTADVIYIQPPRSAADASHTYYMDLLRTVMPEDTVFAIPGNTTPQERSLRLLDTGALTIAWSGTNNDREQRFRPIRVPVYAGLLGIRMPVIRASDKLRFDQISNESELKNLVACQGDQWPDSDILEANGYHVERVPQFDMMYRMLEAGRCDYFPRAITEIYGELAQANNPQLMAYDRVLLSYTFPMYFFTANSNEALASLLESRLLEFAHSGKLQDYIRHHPVTKGAFPLARFRESLIFQLANPDLPDATPLDDSTLWLQLPSESDRQVDAKAPTLARYPVLHERSVIPHHLIEQVGR